MSESTPDLSKIISVIMENPQLIEEISALAKKSESTEEAQSVSEEVTETVSPPQSSEITASVPVYPENRGDKNRTRLLSAFKPYLSKERARAVDSMISIADILDVMKAR